MEISRQCENVTARKSGREISIGTIQVSVDESRRQDGKTRTEEGKSTIREEGIRTRLRNRRKDGIDAKLEC